MIVPLFGKRKEKSSGTLKTYEKAIHDGFAAMKKGDDEKAQLLFRKVLRWVTEDLDKVIKMKDSEKKELSNLLTKAGEAMLRLKDYDYAIKTLERAKTIWPKNFKAWMAIGKDLLQRNTQIPYALVCLREAAKLNPKDLEVHLILGDAYRIQGQIDKALGSYQRVLKMDPNNQDAMEKVLKIQPDNVEILERYAKILEDKKDKKTLLNLYNKLVVLTGEEKYLEKGLEIDPENKELLIAKARMLISNDKYDEAKEVAKKLKEKYPEDPDVQMLYDELVPEEMHVEEEAEEVKPIEISEVFGDISLEEEVPPPTEKVEEKPEEKMEEKLEEKIEEKPEEKVEEIPPEMVKAEKVEKKIEEKPEEKAEEMAVKEEKEEEKAEEKIEEKVEEVKKEEKAPRDEFIENYNSGDYENARKIFEKMSDNDILSLLESNLEILKFVADILIGEGKMSMGERFMEKIVSKEDTEENKLKYANILIENGKIEEAEKILNSLVQKNFKNGRALYLKGRIMAIRDNEMASRNFLTMASKFTPEVKEEIAKDPHLEKYRDKDWFQKIIS